MALRAQFLDAMSSLVSSVSIVTTDGIVGSGGATVSAMTSVSADGDWPTLLLCLNAQSIAASKVLENKCFCVNVLETEQVEIANVFAKRSSETSEDKFENAEFITLETGAPALCAALAVFDCTLRSWEQIGTHYVILGDVKAIENHSGAPLLYGQRAYQKLG